MCDEVVWCDGVEGVECVCCFEVFAEVCEVSAVGLDGVDGEAALDAEVGEEVLRFCGEGVA